MTLLEGIFAIGLGRRWAAMSAAFLAGLFTLLLIAAPAPASDSGALSGDELVGHDPRTGVWTMPDGRTFYYGDPADQPIMCDWDGDGIDTVGLYRSSTGFLHLRHTNDQGFSDIQIFYGIPEDQPVCGDWDGDGVHTIGIYRPSEQRFYLRNTNTQGFADFFFDFAFAGVPIAGDWDGDGIDTVGTYDPATGRVALSRDNSSTVEDLTYFGQAGDTVVTGDWENSGADRLGVVRGESTILSLRSGVVQLDSTPAGTPVAARVTARDPNGVILLDSDTYQQGSIVPVATDISVGATGLVNVTSPAGATSVLYGANLGPLDELGVWTLELTAADQAGNLDPTPAVATLQVVPAAPPVITGLNPAWTVRQGDFLDVSASAQGQGPFAYEWTFGPGMPGAAVADPEPIPITGADSFTGTIEVTDRFGRSSTASFAVAVLPNQPPDGSIESPVAAVAIPSGASISFTGAATDPDGDSVTLSWDFGNSGNASVAGAETGDIFFNSPGEFVVTLTATDQWGVVDPLPPSIDVIVVEPDVLLINPGENIQAVVDANPGPNTFLLGPGTHRNQSVRLSDYQTLEGAPGAILSGARILTDWIYDDANSVWYTPNQTQQGRVTAAWVPSGPVCRETNPRCRYPEDLFIDGEIQLHVDSLGAVAEDSWFFDYDADRIYVKNDPRASLVETSVTELAVYGGADHVTVRNLIVEKYATPTQVGAVDSRLYQSGAGPDGTNWLVDGVEARFNHGAGIFVTDGGHITNSHAHHNGQQGFSARGYGVVIDNSELSYNNTAGYHWDFESGGGKYYRTYDMIFRNNWVHHNYGSGVWFDIANFNALIEDNTVEYNDFDGIFYEVSYGAVIRNNLVVGNGFLDHRGVWLWGAGIIVASSSDVEVYGNEVRDNWNGITAVEQQRGTWEGNPRLVTNLYVHDNLVIVDESVITHNWQYNMPANGYTGLGVDYGDTSFYETRGNRFESNDYQIPTGANLLHWYGIPRDWSTWQGYGNDLDGTVTYVGNYIP